MVNNDTEEQHESRRKEERVSKGSRLSEKDKGTFTRTKINCVAITQHPAAGVYV